MQQADVLLATAMARQEEQACKMKDLLNTQLNWYKHNCSLQTIKQEASGILVAR